MTMNPKKDKNEEVQNAAEAANVPVEPAAEEAAPIETAAEENPPAVQQEIENLKHEVEEAKTKAAEYLDGWQRSRAEFANYKKRIERDQELVNQKAAGNILKRFLEVSDDLDRALTNRPQDDDGAVWANGIDLVYRKLHAILESEGLKVIQTEGQFFDPGLHEAISHEESPAHESGQIIGVVQQGYLLGERVLRPARVRVAR